ncbi:MAG: response regulator [bacterium]
MASQTGKTVLVVDDEPDVVTYLTTVLQDNGYETDSAQNGNEALEKVKQNPPALICLDMSMPEKSGAKFMKELREAPDSADIPILVVTGVTGYGSKPEEFQKFLSTRSQFPPPEGFIAKPIEPEDFIKKVEELVAK